MKRFLTMTILTLSCLCGCFFAHEVRRDTRQETALCLIESFGWTAEKSGIEQREITAHNFYSFYHQWIGEGGFYFINRPVAQEKVAKGNLAGMRPNLYDQTYEMIPDEQMVTLYFIPLDEQMPEHTKLEAIIAFDREQLCMTALHVKLTEWWESAPPSSTWPLGTEKSVLETWKSRYMH